MEGEVAGPGVGAWSGLEVGVGEGLVSFITLMMSGGHKVDIGGGANC